MCIHTSETGLTIFILSGVMVAEQYFSKSTAALAPVILNNSEW